MRNMKTMRKLLNLKNLRFYKKYLFPKEKMSLTLLKTINQ